jgi:hypothetical protein
MKSRGLKSALQGDFWKTELFAQFDTVLLLMNGIGLAGSLETLPIFLEKLKQWLNPGGQVLLESSDILYMFEEEDGSVVLNLNAAYYGEVTYQMAYKGRKGPEFPWLFIDFPLLQDYATEAGFKVECLLEGGHGEYLAKLSV